MTPEELKQRCQAVFSELSHDDNANHNAAVGLEELITELMPQKFRRTPIEHAGLATGTTLMLKMAGIETVEQLDVYAARQYRGLIEDVPRFTPADLKHVQKIRL